MEFKLPELGEGVHEGELVSWKVKVGDKVIDDQPLCEIMTDKATMEIPSHFTGTVAGQLHAKEGDVVTVGQLMITFERRWRQSRRCQGRRPGESCSQRTAPAPGSGGPCCDVVSRRFRASTAARRLEYPGPGASSQGLVGDAMAIVGDTNPATRVLAAPSTRRMARESRRRSRPACRPSRARTAA